MGAPPKIQSHRAAQAVALSLAVVCGWMTQDSNHSPDGLKRELAAKFRFVKRPLPEVGGIPHRNVRTTNPTAARIASWVSSLGAGATIGDVDGDGLPNDIIHADPRTEQVLICPAPGTSARYAGFELTVAGHGRPHVGCSGTILGDFNEDGLADVLVYFLGREPLVFLRKPGQAKLAADAFTATALAPGLEGARWYTTAATQGDLDGDGRIDLVVGNFFPDGSETYDPDAKSLQEMHNSHGWASNGGGIHVLMGRAPTEGDPHLFREERLNLPDNVLHGWCLGLGVNDLDGDLLPEIFVVNDLGPDRLLHNRSARGKLRLALVEGEEGFATPGSFSLGRDTYHGMGCDQFDLNHDGRLDMFISNITCRFGIQESQTLWLSKPGKSFPDGIAPYELVSERWGLARSGWGWDAKFESFSNSVMPDLLQATGYLPGPVNRWPEMQTLSAGNTAFLRDPRSWPRFRPGDNLAGDDLDSFFTWGPDGRYHNVNHEVGLGMPMVSRGVATADVDGDGRMDFALANQYGPSYFFHNESPRVGHFLGLKLIQPIMPAALAVVPGRPAVRGRPAYGAVASVTLPCGTRLVRPIEGGNGHSGRRAAEIHFGLGDFDVSKKLDVKLHWRDRKGNPARATLTLEADRWSTIVLGDAGQEVAR